MVEERELELGGLAWGRMILAGEYQRDCRGLAGPLGIVNVSFLLTFAPPAPRTVVGGIYAQCSRAE